MFLPFNVIIRSLVFNKHPDCLDSPRFINHVQNVQIKGSIPLPLQEKLSNVASNLKVTFHSKPGAIKFSTSTIPRNVVSIQLNLGITNCIIISHSHPHLKELRVKTNGFVRCLDDQLPKLVAFSSSSSYGSLDALLSTSTSLTRLSIERFDTKSYRLPPSLLELRLGNTFNSPVDNLPAGLLQLFIGDENEGYGVFKHYIDHLPPCLEELHISGSFDFPVDNLPTKLRKLTILSSFFCWPLDHLPLSLGELSVNSESFSLPVDHLPEKLVRLTLVPSLAQPLDWLPENLLFLCVSIYSNRSKLHNLPTSLHQLEIVSWDNTNLSLLLSEGITNVKINNCGAIDFLGHVPHSLRVLEVNYLSQMPKMLPHDLLTEVISYAPSITTLTLPSWYNGDIDNLPSTLSSLTVGFAFNQHIDHLPQSMFSLTFAAVDNHNAKFNRPVDYLPSGLSKLEFIGPSLFNQPIDNLPANLQVLKLYSPGEWQKQESDTRTSKKRKQEITLSPFNQPLDNLPQRLFVLEIGDKFQGSLEFLPLTLRVLCLHRTQAQVPSLPWCNVKRVYCMFSLHNFFLL